MSCFRLGFLAILLMAAVTGVNTQAAIVYTVNLDGASEDTPNSSPGVGTATITFDEVLNTMRVEVSFSGLQGTVTNAHIHAATPNPRTGTAGVATPLPTFPGFPAGVSAGSYDQTFDMTLASSFNATYITNNGGTPETAFAALMAASAGERAYLNIHSTSFGAGEIRGFLIAVPEPSSMALLGLSVAGLVAQRRRRS